MTATGIPHPIPYQGSKRQLAATILAHAPRGLGRLIEPFAGSAAISLAAAQRGLADHFWINDAHRPLADLWSAILTDPQAIADQYRALWQSQLGREREFFDRVRDRFNKSHCAADFLYLLARCVKAAVRYNSSGQFNNTPDNRRLGTRPDEMRRRILAAAALLQGHTRATALDYRAVLARATPDDLVYLDPPYQGVGLTRDPRYAPHVSHGELVEALAVLISRQCRFILSYDGRTGSKQFGSHMPKSLGLKHLEIRAGRSSQATLLGRDQVTYESLYLSPALVAAKVRDKNKRPRRRAAQV